MKLGEFLCQQCFDQLFFYEKAIAINIAKENNYCDQYYALAHYQFPLDKLIQTLKYQSVKDIAYYLGKLLWQHCFFELGNSVEVCAVPIHQQRLTERGFNQAEEIAHEFSQASGLAYQPWLIKCTNTKHQAQSKNRAERLAQLENSFAINPTMIQKYGLISQKKHPPNQIIIIDDVLTTGATLNECAKILKQWGIKQVIALVVAHKS